jgi:hypothetical protein
MPLGYDKLQRIRYALCSISGIVPLTYKITWLGALYMMPAVPNTI